MPGSQKSAPAPEHTFESALSRLEQIVDEMEGDRLPLEQLLERYGEGAGLLKICQEKLEVAEKKIEIITRSGGKPQLAPFEPSLAAAPAPEPAEPPRRAPAPDSEEISLF